MFHAGYVSGYLYGFAVMVGNLEAVFHNQHTLFACMGNVDGGFAVKLGIGSDVFVKLDWILPSGIACKQSAI